MSQDAPPVEPDVAATPTARTKRTPPTQERLSADAMPHAARRGIAEWAIVLLLVALIVGVAWSQFGPLFTTSTAGSEGGPPPGSGLQLVAPDEDGAAGTPSEASQANQASGARAVTDEPE